MRTHVGFRAHVKIASRIVSYREGAFLFNVSFFVACSDLEAPGPSETNISELLYVYCN